MHIDGAFGLWAAASSTLAPLAEGLDGADSWTTDAHKTLNVPYDCGVAIVADKPAMRATFGVQASYLPIEGAGPGHPFEKCRTCRVGLAEFRCGQCCGRSGPMVSSR